MVAWQAGLDAEPLFQMEESPTAIISDHRERGYARPFGEPSPWGRCESKRFTRVALPQGGKGNAAWLCG